MDFNFLLLIFTNLKEKWTITVCAVKGQIVESILSFYKVGLDDQIQIVRLDHNHFYLISYSYSSV